MKRDFTLRPNRMQFRYGEDRQKGTGSNSGPFMSVCCPGEKTEDFTPPMPRNPILGAGGSRSITAKDGNGGAFGMWKDPASPVCKPNGKGYKK